jgi:acyl carrier protein
MSDDQIRNEIRTYLKENLLQDEAVTIDDQTPLISGGIIDSISTLKMVDFLEKKFHIEFQPHEVDRDNLDSVELISRFVQSKI